MIKIIISGTYDGFSPRYATDGNLNDTVSQQLLDRRRFLTRESDRLYKDGYSFQQVEGGILYHKIILLFDGFGRDGFMMASLFLPDGEMLDGKDIKETLDAIIKDYKARIQNGIVNVELDWSFVKRRADELNTKVQAVSWGKHPSNGNASKTALMQGAENRIEEFFQFPHPLNSAFEGYGQVFLTESILDPAMVSNDGEQGYKVLAADSVNIDNPEYTIVYDNQQSGARLEGERRSISKKELDQPYGTIPLGTYSRPGYRSQPVFLKAGTKSKDGFCIYVPLPRLEMKRATIELEIVDEKKNPIRLSDCTVLWSKSESGNPIPLTPSGNKFTFLGEDCDQLWYITVRHPLFNEYPDEILIKDNGDETKSIRLSAKPGWKIVLQLPNGNTKKLRDYVAEENLEVQIKEESRRLEKNGFVAKETSRDAKAHTVTIIGREKDQYNYSVPSDSDTFNGNNQPQTDENEYFLRLDPKSKKYSLFKHPQLIDPKLSDEKGINYHPETHRLECICDKEPDDKEIKLGKDKFFKYYIPSPRWHKDTEMYDGSISFVNRKCLKKIKFMVWLALAVVVLGVALAAFLLLGDPGEDEILGLKKEMNSHSSDMLNMYPTCYCGDNLFFKAKKTKDQYENLFTDNSQLKNDSAYIVFNKLFEQQSGYRIQDSTIYSQAMALLDVPTDSFQLDNWNQLMQDTSVLTKEHRDDLKSKYDDYYQTLEAEAKAKQQAEEDALYNRCIGNQGTIQICNQFLTKYPMSIHKEDVERRKKELIDKLEKELYAKCMSPNATVQDCDKYLANFKDNTTPNHKKVTQKKNELGQTRYSKQNTQKKKINRKTELFDALTWDNIKDGGKGFYDIYEINPQFKTEYERRANQIITNASIVGKQRYEKAYQEAKQARATQNCDRLCQLEIRIR